MSLDWHIENGRFFLADSESGCFALNGLSGSIRVNDKMYSISDDQTQMIGDGEFLFPCGIRWKWIVSEGEDHIDLEAVITNEGDTGAALGDWNILHGENAEDSLISIDSDPAQVRCFQWIPWSISLPDLTGEKDLFSCELCHLTDNLKKQTFLAGFITVDRMAADHALHCSDGKITSYRAFCRVTGYTLPAGQTLRSETLRFSRHTDPYEALEYWADTVNRIYKPDFSGTASFQCANGMWACKSLSEKVRSTPGIIDKYLGGFHIRETYGYPHSLFRYGVPGNWLNFEKMDDGTEFPDLFRKLHEEDGWKFKFWFSPFWLFGEAEEAFNETKDFLLRDHDGNLISCKDRTGWELAFGKYENVCMTRYFLDGTHPGTKEYLKKVFSTYRSFGVRSYMLDFLSTVPGAKRYDESMLPLQAARNILLTIRETVGKDTHLQTAVSSSATFIGCINSARVVRDYGEPRPLYPLPNWQNAVYCHNDHHFSNTHSFIQNAAAAWFTNYKIYVNDLNELTIDKPVALNQAQTNVTMVGLYADSPISCGDSLELMDPERLRMLKMLLPRTKGIPRPVDLFENGIAHIVRKEIKTSYETYTLAAVFNTIPEPGRGTVYQNDISFEKLGLDPDKKYRVYEFWNNEYAGTYRTSFPCIVEPGGCKLYRISEAKDHPWLIGTDMHIEQGNAEIESLVYDAEKMTLKCVAVRPAGERGRLFFLMPRNMMLKSNGKFHFSMKEVVDMQTVLNYPVVFEHEKEEITLEFEMLPNDLVSRPGWLSFYDEAGFRKFIEENPYPEKTRVIE